MEKIEAKEQMRHVKGNEVVIGALGSLLLETELSKTYIHAALCDQNAWLIVQRPDLGKAGIHETSELGAPS